MGLICLFEIIAYILIGNIMFIKIKFTRRRAQTSQLRILCRTTFDFDFMHGAVIACILYLAPSNTRPPAALDSCSRECLPLKKYKIENTSI